MEEFRTILATTAIIILIFLIFVVVIDNIYEKRDRNKSTRA